MPFLLLERTGWTRKGEEQEQEQENLGRVKRGGLARGGVGGLHNARHVGT